VTQDGPAHLHNSRILLDHILGRGVESYREYYVPNIRLFPYWLGHLTLAFLLAVFPPAMAEKVYLTGYVVLFALGLRMLLRSINPHATALAFLGLPLICNRAFQMGFMDFSYSIAILLIVVAYCFGRGHDLSIRAILARTLLFLLLYFSHPTVYLLGVATVGSLILCDVFGKAREETLRAFLRRSAVSVGALVVAVLPSMLLLALFLGYAPPVAIDDPISYGTLLRHFVDQTHLMALGGEEEPFARTVPILFFLLVLLAAMERVRSWRLERADGFLLAAGIALAVQLYGAKHLIGFYERMQALPLLLLLPWLALRSLAGIRRFAVVAISSVVVIGLTTLRFPRHEMASAIVDEYVSVLSSIEPGSTVLSMNYDLYGSNGRQHPTSEFAPIFLHSPEYIGAATRSLILLNNYGGLYPYFPYLWREDRNPFFHLQTGNGIEAEPPCADFTSYGARTGGTVDYVLLVGFEPALDAAHPFTQTTLYQLERGYTRAFTSVTGKAILHKARARAVTDAADK
jgi:hypothetical protein